MPPSEVRPTRRPSPRAPRSLHPLPNPLQPGFFRLRHCSRRSRRPLCLASRPWCAKPTSSPAVSVPPTISSTSARSFVRSRRPAGPTTPRAWLNCSSLAVCLSASSTTAAIPRGRRFRSIRSGRVSSSISLISWRTAPSRWPNPSRFLPASNAGKNGGANLVCARPPRDAPRRGRQVRDRSVKLRAAALEGYGGKFAHPRQRWICGHGSDTGRAQRVTSIAGHRVRGTDTILSPKRGVPFVGATIIEGFRPMRQPQFQRDRRVAS